MRLGGTTGVSTPFLKDKIPMPSMDTQRIIALVIFLMSSFLLWEACTRRRPSEKLLIGATYVGFAFLLCLMALVLYLDVFIHPFKK